jgi:ATP-binding cassette subfamily F protein 3
MLQRLAPVAVPREDPSVVFNFPEPRELRPPLITLDSVSVGYEPGKPILTGLSQRLDPDDRIALLGANGNGKSTLAKLIAGRLQPSGGRVARATKVTCGFFAQHQIEDMDAEATPFIAMSRIMKDARPEQVRARLGSFGFAQEKANVKIGDLSGGERARLNFAFITHDAPSLLILDEPTNHLDIQAREALVEALNEYKGAVILISHDRHMVELTADRLWLVAEGKVTPFDDDLDAYERLTLSERARGGAGKSRRNERRDGAQKRESLGPLKKRARDAEALVATLNTEKARLEAELAAPETYNDSKKAAELSRRQGELATRLAAAEDQWLEAQAALDQESAA